MLAREPEQLIFYCDSMRHLVCVPYSIDGLHEMARRLGIKRCWFHADAKYPHYDIPKRRLQEISSQCTVVSPREILEIVRAVYPGSWDTVVGTE